MGFMAVEETEWVHEPLMVFDGHNDLVLRHWVGEAPTHVALEEAERYGFGGGFFALYIADPQFAPPAQGAFPDYPLAPPVPFARAAEVADELLTVIESLPVTIARTVADIRPGRINALMHLEGAEPIAPDLSNLEQWYERGLRSIGLTWARANAFAEGVPFRFPSRPDTGPGLTAAGEALVEACNRLGILIDLSHLNEAGFWDVARLSSAPLVATHSNAHALCEASRNLTDEQLDAIAASGGVVGVNFATQFLREDGRIDPATPVSEILRHVDYLVQRMGIDHVALGSDFEGALIPAGLGGVRGLPGLLDALRARGYDERAVAKIAHGNWLRVLDETWRPPGGAPETP